MAVSTACSSSTGRYWRVLTRLSHEASRCGIDSLIWRSARGSQVSYSIHCMLKRSSKRPISTTPAGRKL